MGIRFQCPTCRRFLTTHEKMAARKIRCPDCDTQLVVPTPKVVQPIRETIQREAIPLVKSVAPLGDLAPDEFRTRELVESSPQVVSALEETPKRKPRRHKEKEQEETDTEWDITPMVDVVFLLLIFFMLTASFSIQNYPHADSAQRRCRFNSRDACR